MQWSKLDNPTDPAVWTLPGTRAKNGKTHIVHFSQPARAILRSLLRDRGNPFVFAGQSAIGGLAAFRLMKSGIDRRIAETDAPLPEWRFHDFRRAAVTALARMGFPPHVCDRLLNHITGTIQGVAAVYQRHEFLAERQTALEVWANDVLVAVEGRKAASNVVELRREAV
jgi:integrase